jgi:hypothetical protein
MGSLLAVHWLMTSVDYRQFSNDLVNILDSWGIELLKLQLGKDVQCILEVGQRAQLGVLKLQRWRHSMGSWGRIEVKLRLGICLRQLVLVLGQRSIEGLVRSIVVEERSIVVEQVVAIGCIVELVRSIAVVGQVVAIGCIGELELGCGELRYHRLGS